MNDGDMQEHTTSALRAEPASTGLSLMASLSNALEARRRGGMTVG